MTLRYVRYGCMWSKIKKLIHVRDEFLYYVCIYCTYTSHMNTRTNIYIYSIYMYDALKYIHIVHICTYYIYISCMNIYAHIACWRHDTNMLKTYKHVENICTYRMAKTHRMPWVEGHFRKRATHHRALLRKMTYKDKASYDSTPSCITYIYHVWIYVYTLQKKVKYCTCIMHEYIYIRYIYVLITYISIFTAHVNEAHEMRHVTYTATHCNTLRHTATHCNTFPHTATHCNTMPQRHMICVMSHRQGVMSYFD